MSEYQCYEFVALDVPLTPRQQAELRAISTRAEISSIRFWNEYHWGDLKAEPAKLLERYFDAHLYFSNWGSRRLMLRMPRARVDAKALQAFFVGRDSASLKRVGEHVVLDLHRDTEEPPEEDEENQGSLSALTPLRMELMAGDLRGAYLAWLLAVQADEVEDDTTEPPVPPGLATLSTAQQALVEFLCIDGDLLAAAAQDSSKPSVDGAAFRRWVSHLPASRKDAWLLRAADEPELPLGAQLLRAFRAEHSADVSKMRRSVGELRALAQTQRTAREEARAARAKRTRAAADKQRQQRLDMLARNVPAAWSRLEEFVSTSAYEDAVTLAVDLRDLAQREGTVSDFEARFESLHRRLARRRGFFSRWKQA